MANAITNSATMCNRCPKAPMWTATGWKCPIYADVTKVYGARNGSYCPFNIPVVEGKKAKAVNALKQSKRDAKGK